MSSDWGDSGWDVLNRQISSIDKLPSAARAGEISRIAKENKESPQLVSLLRLNYRLPPERPQTLFAPGDVIAERYEIVGELGHGGMGVVYKAIQAHTERTVAIKVIHPYLLANLTPDSDLSARFLKEIATLGGLKHPGIVTIYEADVFTINATGKSTLFFAMELVDGSGLDDYARESRLSPREAAQLMAQVCDGVHHAHECDIIHRDLKPANIVVDSDGAPIILDFGLANPSLDALGHDTAFMLSGTPQYMSPEQLSPAVSDSPAAPACDIYALGVVAYELTVGTRLRPFPKNKTLREIRDEILSAPEPNMRLPFRHRRIGSAISKALRKDATMRYATAADFAIALRKAARPVITRVRAITIAACLIVLALTFGFAIPKVRNFQYERLLTEIDSSIASGDADTAIEKIRKAQSFNKVARFSELRTRAAAAFAIERTLEVKRRTALEIQPARKFSVPGLDKKGLPVFSPDQDMVVVASGDRLQLYRVSDKMKLAELYSEQRDNPYSPASRKPGALSFSHDASQLAVGSPDSQHVLIWDILTGSLAAALFHNSPVTALQWRSDGVLLAGTKQGAVYWWQDLPRDGSFVDMPKHRIDTSSNAEIEAIDSREVDDAVALVTRGALFITSPRGITIASLPLAPDHAFARVEIDPSGLSVTLFDSAIAERIWWQTPNSATFVRPFTDSLVSLIFLPVGRQFAVASDQRVSVIDSLSELETESLLVSRCGGIASNDRALFVSDRSGINIWSLDQGQQTLTKQTNPIMPPASGSPITLAREAETLFVATAQHLRTINTANGLRAEFKLPRLRFRSDPSEVFGATADGTLFAFTDDRRACHVYRIIGSEPPQQQYKVQNCLHAEFTADSQSLIILQSTGDLQVLNRSDWGSQAIAEIPSATCFDLSDDNRYLVTGHANGMLELRSYPSLELLTGLPYPYEDGVESVILSPDGGTAVAVTSGKNLIVWRLHELHTKLINLNLAWAPTGNHYKDVRNTQPLTFKP